MTTFICSETGKVRYASRSEASRLRHREGLRSYHCSACDGWHLSSRTFSKRTCRTRCF